MGKPRTRVVLLGLVAFVLLAAPATAFADVRFAAPAGTGADPCASPADPCSLFVAADGGAPSTTLAPGDVVEMAPGIYSESDGDLGAGNFINVPTGVTVRGEAGQPRPLIRLESGAGVWGAFYLGGATASHLSIENEGSTGAALTMDEGGTVEGVIARSTLSNSITCAVFKGLVRDTVCLNEGSGVALGASLSSFAGARPITLRNVTAIASGGSAGVDFNFSGAGVVGQVEGKSVLAKGETNDVVARADTGATTTIALDHSDYATTATSGAGTTSVTAAGTNENVTAAPLLAADGYHQLAESPTVDTGAVDGSSGALDVDDQPRTIGLAPDIGADELAHSTGTGVVCSPASLTLGASSTCTATVTDISPGGSPPSGSVAFGSSGSGSFSGGGACTLVGATATQSSCQVTYTPTQVGSGSHTITATYAASGSHEGSQGTTSVNVAASTKIAGPGKVRPTKAKAPPETTIGKKPAKRTKKRVAKFTFSSSQSRSTFQCKLDRKPFRRCSSPFKRKVRVGRHRFRVRAVNKFGVADPTPASYRWRVLPG